MYSRVLSIICVLSLCVHAYRKGEGEGGDVFAPPRVCGVCFILCVCALCARVLCRSLPFLRTCVLAGIRRCLCPQVYLCMWMRTCRLDLLSSARCLPYVYRLPVCIRTVCFLLLPIMMCVCLSYVMIYVLDGCNN